MIPTAAPQRGTVYRSATCMNCDQGIWDWGNSWVHHDDNKACAVMEQYSPVMEQEDPRIADGRAANEVWRFDSHD